MSRWPPGLQKGRDSKYLATQEAPCSITRRPSASGGGTTEKNGLPARIVREGDGTRFNVLLDRTNGHCRSAQGGTEGSEKAVHRGTLRPRLELADGHRSLLLTLAVIAFTYMALASLGGGRRDNFKESLR